MKPGRSEVKARPRGEAVKDIGLWISLEKGSPMTPVRIRPGLPNYKVGFVEVYVD